MSVGSAGSCGMYSHGESNFGFCESSSVRMFALLRNTLFGRSTREIQFDGDGKEKLSILQTISFAAQFSKQANLCRKRWRHFMNKSDPNNLNENRVKRISRITLTRKRHKGKIGNFAEWQPRQRCHQLKIFETLARRSRIKKNCVTEKNPWELLYSSAYERKIRSKYLSGPRSLSFVINLSLRLAFSPVQYL